MARNWLIGAGIATLALASQASAQLFWFAMPVHPRTGVPIPLIVPNPTISAQNPGPTTGQANPDDGAPGWSSDAARRAAEHRVKRPSPLTLSRRARWPLPGNPAPDDPHTPPSDEPAQPCPPDPAPTRPIVWGGTLPHVEVIENTMFAQVDGRLIPRPTARASRAHPGTPASPASSAPAGSTPSGQPAQPAPPTPAGIDPDSLLAAHPYRPAELLREDDTQRVLDELEGRVRDDPDDAELARVLAVGHLLEGDHARGAARLHEAYRTFPPLAAMPLDAEALPGGASQLRSLVSRTVRLAHRRGGAADWLATAVLMQARGRSKTAINVLNRAERAGLESAIADPLREALQGPPNRTR